MSTTAAQVTTCFYLLMQIACWLHVLFVLILIIYLFTFWKQCQQKQVKATTCFYLLMLIGCWLHVVFVLILIIYLFIYSNRCQQKQVEATTCFYLLMLIGCWLHVVFVLIFMIYLFIYSKRCQQKQVELTTFIYLWKSLLVTHGFRLNIHYLFIYLFKAMSAKAGGTDDFYYTCLWFCPQLVDATKTCMVGKRAARILLECFLVYLSKLVVVIYLWFIFRNPSLESYYSLN